MIDGLTNISKDYNSHDTPVLGRKGSFQRTGFVVGGGSLGRHFTALLGCRRFRVVPITAIARGRGLKPSLARILDVSRSRRFEIALFMLTSSVRAC